MTEVVTQGVHLRQAVEPEERRPSSGPSSGPSSSAAPGPGFRTASDDGGQQKASGDGAAGVRRGSRGSFPWAAPRAPSDDGGGGMRGHAGWYSMPGERRTLITQARLTHQPCLLAAIM